MPTYILYLEESRTVTEVIVQSLMLILTVVWCDICIFTGYISSAAICRCTYNAAQQFSIVTTKS